MAAPRQLSDRRRRALIVAELARRREARANVPDFQRGLFDKQLAVFHDPSRNVDVLGSRRSGKSTVAAAWLLDGAYRSDKRNFLFPYIAQSRKNAKLIIWKEIKDIVLRLGLSDRVHIDNTELSVTFKHNGCAVILGGCNDRGEIEKWRGLKMGRCVIDECGAMPWLEDLVSVIRPSLADVAGQLWRMGNPGLVMSGLWYELTGPHRECGPGSHTWDLFENPAIPLAHKDALAEKAERGWADDHPRWLREYRGKWAYDPETVAFPYDSKWDVGQLPVGLDGWRYVLGVDVGHVDANAYVVWASHPNLPGEYIVESRKQTGQLIDQFIADVRRYRDRYPGLVVVVDSGGMGKQHWAELSRRGLPAFPADKRDKASAINVLHDRTLGGHVHLLRGKETDAIRDEFAILRRKDSTWELEDDQEDHCAHAALYGHRFLRKYLYEPRQEQPREGSPEAYAREAAELKEQRRIRIVRPQRPAHDQ